jgi:DNA mismatch repair protein MutS
MSARDAVLPATAVATLPRKPVDEPARPSPMMAQYIEIKANNPDCLLFYRMGDFYELFFHDAEVASRALGIVLTKRGKHQGDDIPMCGVPIERADDYLHRLIGLGHRVAVCEQLEDPAEAKKRGPKSVVRRDVVRLVTPGTITEDRLLDPSRANVLVAVARARASDEEWAYGIAALDISTGAFALTQASAAGLGAEIARLDPREIVAPEAVASDASVARAFEDSRAPLTPFARDAADAGAAERVLRDWYGLATLDGLGDFSRAELAAAALAIRYVERTQLGARPPLAFPTRERRDAIMEIDAATRANLELTRTLAGARDGSLLAAIDMSVTPSGGRLLAERLASPLTDVEAIARRQESIAFLLDDVLLRADARKALAAAPDMERALARLALDRGGPRDLAAMRDGAGAVAALAARLARSEGLPPEIADAAAALTTLPSPLESELRGALADDLPLNRRDGGFVRAGCIDALDEARALRDESRRVVASLQAKYCDLADARTLRIKHNNFLGWFLEVPQAQGEKLLREPLNATFIHRQTMQGAMRFSTGELADLESKIASAADRALAIEFEVHDRLRALVLEHSDALKSACAALAVLDVACALAELAAKRDWKRPKVEDSLAFEIDCGRHPVVEAALKSRGESFIANNCDLTDPKAAGGRIAVVTGPNMAGKSTYLRQNALIAVLAQMGAYVPADRARIGVVDRLFSRVGAADDLARGRSTFMVEMVETAAILNQATPRSLVILDEIGRGTATFDGLSIAWAAIERLHETNRSRALFATHFHELTQLTKKLPRLYNITMRVADFRGDIVFLHEVALGAADRSYGIHVAKLAGLPPDVLARAQVILSELEASERQAPVQRLVDDLPLFAAFQPRAPEPPKVDALREMLDGVDPDELTPRAALDALYLLKKERSRET